MFELLLGYYIEFLSAIIALVVWKRLNVFWVRIFAVVCWIIVAAESIGLLVGKVLVRNNNIVFNISFPLSVVLFVFALQKIIRSTGRNCLPQMVFSIIGFALFTLVNLQFVQGWLNQNYYTMLAGYLLIIIWCLIALLSMIENQNIRINFRSPAFLAVVGLLIPAICSFMYRAFIMVDYEQKLALFKIIIIGMAVFRYACFSLIFLIVAFTRQESNATKKIEILK